MIKKDFKQGKGVINTICTRSANKKYLKKTVCVIAMLAFSFPLALLFGCDRKNDTPDIVVSGFAQYDFVREILGNNPAGLTVGYLLENGVDLHNYLPSVKDIAAISSCKLFVYTDSDAEKWISGAIQNPKNTQRKTLNLMSLLSNDEKIALDEESGHVHDENCVHTYDEHIWLSLKLSQKFVLAIADRLGEIDPDNDQEYSQNAQSYLEKMQLLDSNFEEIISQKSIKKILFADRYPFSYLMRDYGIEAFAAFSGCAADTEVSVQRVTELKEYFLQNQLEYVLILENSDDRLAKQITIDTSAKIETLNSMQSVTANQLGNSYLSMMEANLEVLDLVIQ